MTGGAFFLTLTADHTTRARIQHLKKLHMMLTVCPGCPGWGSSVVGQDQAPGKTAGRRL